MIRTKYEGKINWRVWFELFQGLAQKSRKIDIRRRKKKEMVAEAKPEVLLVHALCHRVKNIGIFQTPLYKAVFGGWIASHVSSK
jgi:hypothetical protein